MVPNIIRMILLKSKINSEIYAQDYAINVNNIISIDLKKDNKTGKIVICTVDKYVFTIYKKPDIIYDLYTKILSFCTNSSNSDVIPDNILEIESD